MHAYVTCVGRGGKLEVLLSLMCGMQRGIGGIGGVFAAAAAHRLSILRLSRVCFGGRQALPVGLNAGLPSQELLRTEVPHCGRADGCHLQQKAVPSDIPARKCWACLSHLDCWACSAHLSHLRMQLSAPCTKCVEAYSVPKADVAGAQSCHAQARASQEVQIELHRCQLKHCAPQCL